MVDIQRQSQNGKPEFQSSAGPTPVDHERGALIVKELTGSATLATLVGKNLQGAVPPSAYKTYRDQLLRDSGQPNDAIEVMLIEQLMWAHHRIGDLHVQASTASSPETTVIYSTAAAKLMAEFRRTSLALREYRSPFSPKNITLVRQQNLSAGNQKIALVDNRPNGVGPHPTESEPVLLENQKALTHEKATAFRRSQTAAARSRKLKQLFPDPLASGQTPSAYDLNVRQRTLNLVDLFNAAMQLHADNRQSSTNQQIAPIAQPTPTRPKKKKT